MLNELTKIASGVVGVSQAIGVDIAVITDPGPGRYRVWGSARHTLVDGVRLLVGTTTIIANISSGAGASTSFGPIILDVLNRTDDIILELATATGGADSASGTLYAERIVAL